MSETSIIELKANFIRSQVRQLSAPLEPSAQWQATSQASSRAGQLSDKSVQDIVTKLNETIQKHNRLVYSAPSQRHVAEQIETLYWNRAKAIAKHADKDTLVIPSSADLTDSEVIKTLPEDYADLFLQPESHEASEEDATRYARLRTTLVDTSAKRDELQKKLDAYKRLREMCKPLENPRVNVQPNLVTKDGELATEMDRMRVLLARVSARLQDNKVAKADSMASRPAAMSKEQKMQEFMDMT